MHIPLLIVAAAISNPQASTNGQTAPTANTTSASSVTRVSKQSDSVVTTTQKWQPTSEQLGPYAFQEESQASPLIAPQVSPRPVALPRRRVPAYPHRMAAVGPPYPPPPRPAPFQISKLFREKVFTESGRPFFTPCPEGSCPSGECTFMTCCPEFWVHRTGFYWGLMYLSARGADTRYTTPVDGLLATSVPINPIGVVDPAYRSGFRLGLTIALTEVSSLTAEYTNFNSHTSSSAALPGGTGFLRSDVTHPNTANVAADSLSARAGFDIDFRTVDANYRALFLRGEKHVLNYVLGLRYGSLNQEFGSGFFINGATSVDTDIDFHGVGPRVGIDSERILGRGWHVYGKGAANFLIGTFDAEYLQQNIAAGQQARTGYEEDRIVPVLELEAGLGWRSRCGRFHWTAGYYVGAWFNSMTTPAFIDAVRQDRFRDLDETLTFDGFATRFLIQL